MTINGLNNPLLLFRGEKFDPNFFYFSKVDIDHAFLFLQKERKTLFVPEMNASLARELFNGDNDEIVVYKGSAIKTVKKYLKSKKISKISFDGFSLDARRYQNLSKYFTLQDISEKLSIMRAKKTGEEVEKIEKAVSITKEILSAIDFSKHVTESDVKKFILKETLEKGAEPAFEPIVASGKNSRFPHYRGGNARIKEWVLIDYGVKIGHYCADLTRCFNLSSNSKMNETYLGLQAMTDLILKKFPYLKKGSDVAAESDKLFKKHSLPLPPHSIGHGIGLDVHESPHLGRTSKEPLAGSVIAIEPAVYFSDFGARYEETVYFDGKKAVVL